MHFFELTLGILAVWRVTHLLNAEDGPWDVLVRLCRGVGAGFWGSLLDCFYCLSLWTAAPFALFFAEGWREQLLWWLALSAGAILLQRVTQREPGELRAVYHEETEEEHGMLRRQETKSDGPGEIGH